MKNLKFLQILLLVTLVACTSCEEREGLPGSKPDMLIGKWEALRSGGLFYESPIRLERYEFTKTGGFIVETYYDKIEKVFLKPDTSSYFTDWSYSEENETIYFENSKGSRWELYACELTPDSVRLGCGIYMYYRVK